MSFKICVVGCGGIAQSMHGPAYAKYAAINTDVKLAGCCDIDQGRAKDFAARFGFVNAYADMEEMLRRERPDAVCLLSPVQLTARLAAKILDEGIPLLLEKPPGLTGQETSRLAEIAAKKNVPHRVAFNRRYSPLVRRLKRSLELWEPGAIRSIAYDMFRVNRLDPDFSTTAIHAIDAARYIAGSDYRRVRFTYRGYPGHEDFVRDVFMDCEMKSGASVRISIAPSTGILAERALVNLCDHSFALDFLGQPLCPTGRLTSLRGNKVEYDLAGDEAGDGGLPFEREGFYYENSSFFDGIIARVYHPGDLSAAVQSVEVARYLREGAAEYVAS